MTFGQRIKRMGYRYQQFIEKQGFPIIMTVCVAVIVLSAVWSDQMDNTLPTPTSPVDQAQSAARLQQESLSDAATPAPSPTTPVSEWTAPLENMSVLRSFHASRMERSEVSGMWQIHDAVDLQAEYGAPVMAIADGTVLACTQEGVLGISVSIDHGDGVTAVYACLSASSALRPGDPVDAGQTVGFIGNSMLEEAKMAPHLHLCVTRNGTAVDPLSMLSDD